MLSEHSGFSDAPQVSDLELDKKEIHGLGPALEWKDKVWCGLLGCMGAVTHPVSWVSTPHVHMWSYEQYDVRPCDSSPYCMSLCCKVRTQLTASPSTAADAATTTIRGTSFTRRRKPRRCMDRRRLYTPPDVLVCCCCFSAATFHDQEYYMSGHSTVRSLCTAATEKFFEQVYDWTSERIDTS